MLARTSPSKSKLEMPAVEELSAWSWQQTEMASDLALKLGFAVGNVSASAQSRMLMAEF